MFDRRADEAYRFSEVESCSLGVKDSLVWWYSKQLGEKNLSVTRIVITLRFKAHHFRYWLLVPS
jgi:hypothetical protein